MIELSFSELLISLVAGAFLFCGWSELSRRWSDQRREKKERRLLMRCRYCATPFLRDGGERLEKCPRCHAKNQSGRDRRLG